MMNIINQSLATGNKTIPHYLISDGPGPLRDSNTYCPFCCKFIRSHLKRHISSVHLKLKPFTCENCGKAFSRKTHLVQHSNRRHPGCGTSVSGKHLVSGGDQILGKNTVIEEDTILGINAGIGGDQILGVNPGDSGDPILEMSSVGDELGGGGEAPNDIDMVIPEIDVVSLIEEFCQRYNKL